MTTKPAIKGALWVVPGAAVMLFLILLVAHFQKGEDATWQLAFKARRADLVSRMQLGLSSASEAEKSAVMAITDQESTLFADQARAATTEVERERQELEGLQKTGGTGSEKDLFVQFSKAFTEFQHLDNDLLALAVKNSNLKAYSLAFGPAADATNEMNDALSRMVAANAESPDAKKIMLLAFDADLATLRIQTLLAPHIAEESDEKMGRIEASMTKEDERVRNALKGLKARLSPSGSADLARAVSAYARFSSIRAEILKLSRENTNVRSLAISLNEMRKATVLCQDGLSTLKQAILEEPIKGVVYGPPARPR